MGTGESATFTGPSTVANIVSRVTGGQPSSIDGQLRSEITGANLFLLNPSGVVFGPHASLDVSGAFHISTADFLRFADGTTFSTHLSRESVLTVAPPAAFGFLGPNPASITIRGSSLQVPAGQTLSVVGGDVDIVGQSPLTNDSIPTLWAPGGRIYITSVAAAGEVPINLPEFNVNSFGRLGGVALSQGALIDASGDGGGAVLIRNGHLILDGSAIFADNRGERDGVGLGIDLRVTGDAVLTQGAAITTDSLGAGRARDLRITAGRVLMTDASMIGSTSRASGDGGNVVVQAGQLTLTGGAFMTTSTEGLGHGGDLTVAATKAIAVDGGDREGNPSGLFSIPFSSGDGGRLFISAPTVSIDGGRIQTVTARCESGRCGNAGSIEVRAERLMLTDGAQIDVGTRSLGHGGDLTVMATETITITGRASQDISSGLFGTVGVFDTPMSTGDGGRLFISAPTVSIDGGRILSESFSNGNAGPITLEVGRLTLTGGAQISSSARGLGRGGELTVIATETITIAGRDSEGNPSGLFSAARGPGRGGTVQAAAAHFQLTNGGTISANSTGDGDAGAILIQADETFRSQHSAVTTATEEAGGGAIALNAGFRIWLTDSVITTTVRGGGGDAGNITANTQYGILDGSQIIANAFEGQGGNIRIQAQTFLRDPASLVDASSALGINGQVNIQAPVTSLSGAVAPLQQAFAQTAELLRSRCAERLREGTVSRFVIGGRDGVPLEPGSLLLSPLQQVDLKADVQEGTRQPQSPEPPHAWVTSAQAHAREGWEGECARWMVQPKPSGIPKRRR